MLGNSRCVRKTTSNKTRVPLRDGGGYLRLRLPDDPWFLSLLRDRGFEETAQDISSRSINWDVARRAAHHNVNVHGVILTKPRQLLGEVFNFLDREEELLRKYMLQQRDLLSLKVMQVEMFAGGPVAVYSHNRGNFLKTRHDSVYLAADLTQHAFVSGTRQQSECVQSACGTNERIRLDGYIR